MNLGLLLRLTGTLVIGFLIVWLSASLLGQIAFSIESAVITRTVLGALILVLLTRRAVRAAHAGPELLPTVAVAGLVSYALSPSTWVGRSLLTQIVLAPGWVTVAGDLALWLAVVVIAARSVDPQPRPAPSLPYQ